MPSFSGHLAHRVSSRAEVECLQDPTGCGAHIRRGGPCQAEAQPPLALNCALHWPCTHRDTGPQTGSLSFGPAAPGLHTARGDPRGSISVSAACVSLQSQRSMMGLPSASANLAWGWGVEPSHLFPDPAGCCLLPFGLGATGSYR